MNSKRCPHCDTVKSIEHFGKNVANRDGLSSWCLRCKADFENERSRANPERKRASNLRSTQKNRVEKNRKDRARYHKDKLPTRERNLQAKFGIGLAEFDQLLAQQDGKCAVCGVTESNSHQKNLCVDHSHATGDIRGLLCSRCNLAAGYLDDSAEKILKLLIYLLRSGLCLEHLTLRAPSLTEQDASILQQLADGEWGKEEFDPNPYLVVQRLSA